jgi:hypothetical protein
LNQCHSLFSSLTMSGAEIINMHIRGCQPQIDGHYWALYSVIGVRVITALAWHASGSGGENTLNLVESENMMLESRSLYHRKVNSLGILMSDIFLLPPSHNTRRLVYKTVFPYKVLKSLYMLVLYSDPNSIK